MDQRGVYLDSSHRVESRTRGRSFRLQVAHQLGSVDVHLRIVQDLLGNRHSDDRVVHPGRTGHYEITFNRIQYQISQLQYEQEKNQLKQTIYQAHADAKASYNSYLAAEKSVEASRESFNYAKERYELGAINQFDYETAKNSLAVAQSEMLRAKYDYIFKLKVLEFYLTNEIKL